MVRGRRRVAAPAGKIGENPPHPLTPVRRLDGPYASPASKITSYFAAEEKKMPDDGLRLSPRKHASTTSILQQARKDHPYALEKAPDDGMFDDGILPSRKSTPCILRQMRLDHPYAITLDSPVATTPDGNKTKYIKKKLKRRRLSVYSSRDKLISLILDEANNIEKKSPHRIEMTAATVVPKPKPRRKVVSESIDNKVPKVTDYFPVRRSVRKTKRTVLEEKQRHIENAILSEREDGLEVHCFPGKGRGVVATRPFKKGDFVVEYAGELISLDEARAREQKYAQDQNTGCYMYYFVYRDVQYCIDATPESKRLGRLVNHSRNGNLSTKSISIGGVPRLVLIAKDDINVGDELMYDYGDRSKESLYYHPWLAL